MRKSLMKNRAWLQVGLSNTPTMNLLASNFEFDRNGESVAFSFDLSPNIKTSNKSEHSFLDAMELNENRHLLYSIELTDSSLLSAMIKKKLIPSSSDWMIHIHLGDFPIISKLGRVSMRNDGLIIYLTNLPETANKYDKND